MRHALIMSILCLPPLHTIAGQDEAFQAGKSSDSAIYKDEISGFHVGDANALDVVNLLNDQFPNLTFSAEPTTNRIYARVPKPLIDEIEEFVEELAIAAAEHRQRQEVLRRKLEEEEQDRRQRDLDRRRAEEQKRLKEQEEQAEKNAVGLSNQTFGWNSGFTFEMPLGMRLARTQLQAAELKLKKMQATYGPNHPSIRNAELEVEAIKNLVTPRLDFVKQYTATKLGTRQTTSHQRLEFLTKIMKELRPDLKVELEGIDQGLVIFRGSEDAVEEAQRIMQALEEVARNSDPAALQKQYEKAEQTAANIARQLREANSTLAPDEIRTTELRGHLSDAVQTAFDLRMQLQQSQLERAEADLITARARLIRREHLAAQIIERRVTELENADETSWFQRHSSGADDDNQTDKAAGSSLPDTGKNDLSKASSLPGNLQNIFGIEFGESIDFKESKTKYRGGIRVKSIIPLASADSAGIRTGDILVGLEKWETTSLNDVDFVFKELGQSVAQTSIRFYIVRNGETVFGEMQIPDKDGSRSKRS